MTNSDFSRIFEFIEEKSPDFIINVIYLTNRLTTIVMEDNMRFQQQQVIPMCLRLGKAVIFFFVGGALIHTITMLFDYYLLNESFHLNWQDNFVSSIFSAPMTPMMVIYGMSALTMYVIWDRQKKAVLLANSIKVQSENTQAVLKSMQRLTGILAEHIAVRNAEIMKRK